MSTFPLFLVYLAITVAFMILTVVFDQLRSRSQDKLELIKNDQTEAAETVSEHASLTGDANAIVLGLLIHQLLSNKQAEREYLTGLYTTVTYISATAAVFSGIVCLIQLGRLF